MNQMCIASNKCFFALFELTYLLKFAKVILLHTWMDPNENALLKMLMKIGKSRTFY